MLTLLMNHHYHLLKWILRETQKQRKKLGGKYSDKTTQPFFYCVEYCDYSPPVRKQNGRFFKRCTLFFAFVPPYDLT